MSERRNPRQEVGAAGPGSRLIEAAFPLRQTSLDSVHEKNVRHGHISTLHIWPARRPLAACRAVLLATLLPDPGDAEGRRRLMARIAGEVRQRQTRAGKLRDETDGGVLHWGRESEPELEKLREEIREAFGGRAPRVLDPFAGGGAIPLEAMRLGCEVTASDLNPVAWFVLRCTLHYPRLVAGQELPLPDFAVRDRTFVEACLKARGVTRKAALREELRRLGHGDGDPVQVRSALLDGSAEPRSSTGADSAGPTLEAGFPWHLRAWGHRVLAEARRDLANRYPTYADFEPVRRKGRRRRNAAIQFPEQRFRQRPPRLLEPDAHGNVSGRRVERGVGPRLPGERGESPLDCEAHGRLLVGADDPLPELPGGASLAQDALAVQEAGQAGAALDDAAGGRFRRGVRCGARRADRRGEPGAAPRARPPSGRRDDEPQRRRLPLLRRHLDDGRFAQRGARRPARRADDGRGHRRATGQGVSAPYRG